MNGNPARGDIAPEYGMTEQEYGYGISPVTDAVRRHLLYGCRSGAVRDMLEQLAGRIRKSGTGSGRMDESALLLLVRILAAAAHVETGEDPAGIQGAKAALGESRGMTGLYFHTEKEEDAGEHGARQASGKEGCAAYRGRTFWSGSVSLPDGRIEEVHSYREAQEADFHAAFYFSQEQCLKMECGESAFFCVRESGEVDVDWEDPRMEAVASEIRKQITLIRR